jgi:hypothetical protein
MLIREILFPAKDLVNALATVEYLLTKLGEFSSFYDGIVDRMDSVVSAAGGSPAQSQAINNLNQQIASAIPSIRNSRQFSIFRDLQVLQDALKRYLQSNNADLRPHDSLTRVDDFADAYQTFFSDQTTNAAFRLARSAKILQTEIDSIRAASLSILNLNAFAEDTSSSEERLTIELSEGGTFAGLLTKLTALQDLYEEACMLAGISSQQFPLRMLRVESGSARISIAGHPIVISVVTAICMQGLAIVEQNWTQHGKRDSSQEELKALRESFDLTKELQAKGIDVMDSQDRITKASEVAIKRLTTLISGETRVEINDELYILSMDQSAKLLEQRKRALPDKPNDGSQPKE